MNKKLMFFYVVELISAISLTLTQGFLGLMWLAIAISFIGIIPKLQFISFSVKTKALFQKTCLILSSVLWGYIVMYFLSSAPIIYTILLVARIIATIITFKEIKNHIIVVIPLLIGFALLKQAGCIPPIAF